MFRNLFNPESPLMVTMTQVTDCIFLSLFFVLGCIPVVTVVLPSRRCTMPASGLSGKGKRIPGSGSSGYSGRT